MTSAALPASRRAAVVATGLSVGVQVGLVVLGVAIVLLEEQQWLAVTLLGIWCIVGAAYSAIVIAVLGRRAQRVVDDESAAPTAFEVSRFVRFVSVIATVLASVVGIIAAGQVLVTDAGDTAGFLATVVGVVSMLLSWGLLHWGFAQIYYQRHFVGLHRDGGLGLEFPGTTHPRLVDFVYFSYAVGTSFAASDVQVRTARTRWLVTWHSVISFFFNGLIIVFAMTTIMNL